MGNWMHVICTVQLLATEKRSQQDETVTQEGRAGLLENLGHRCHGGNVLFH